MKQFLYARFLILHAALMGTDSECMLPLLIYFLKSACGIGEKKMSGNGAGVWLLCIVLVLVLVFVFVFVL